MTIKCTFIFLLLSSSLFAQDRAEDYANIKHTLEDFNLKGKVKEMTVIHSGFNYKNGKEEQQSTVARTKYIFNENGKLDTLIVFSRDSSIHNILTLSYDKQGLLTKVIDTESFYKNEGNSLRINKEMDFNYVISSDSKTPKKVASITIDEQYHKYQLIYEYDEKGQLIYVENKLTEKDNKNSQNEVEIEAFNKKYVYNKDGSLKQIKSSYNDKVDGTLDNIEYFDFDESGNLIKTHQKHLEKDEWSPPQTKTYNNQGKLLHYYEGDSTVNKLVYSHYAYYYSEDQTLLKEYYHYHGDGEFEWFKKYAYSWDEKGNWIEVKTYLKELAHHYKKEGVQVKFTFDRRDKREILYFD
jgi:hypothetical protein